MRRYPKTKYDSIYRFRRKPMLGRVIRRLRGDIAYMKEMVTGGSTFFFEKGEFAERASLSDVRSNKLRGYYIDARRTVSHYHLWPPMTTLDDNGVTRADYSRWGRPEIGVQYHPIGIAQYALGNFELYLDTGNSSYKQAFLNQVYWLMENAKITTSGAAVWEFGYSFMPRYNLSIPWISAMAQGQIISVLLRAYQLTEDAEFFNTAERALRTFHHATHDGGVTWTDAEGLVFYEEYPTEPPTHVLNGHVWAMFGVYDYYRVTNSQDALNLFNAGVSTVKTYLPRFDTGYWSKYDLVSKPGFAPIRYQYYHIELLRVLYEITGEEVLSSYARRWSSYLKPGNRARFAFHVACQRMREDLKHLLRR